jgi:phenylalanyl-tRNA synthetase alpha chain
MADEQIIIESLSPIERAVLPILSKGVSNLDEVAKTAEFDKTTALRALEFLKNKNLVEIDVGVEKIVQAGINGLFYLKKGLPERRLLMALGKKKIIPFGEIKSSSGLSPDEIKVSIGILKKKAVADIKNGRLVLTGGGNEMVRKMLEETFLEKLPIAFDKLEAQDKLALENLKSRRNIVEVIEEKSVSANLTSLGVKISGMDLKIEMIEQLTPKMIKTSGYKGKKFRRYDITSPVPRIYGGKRHFVNQATDHAKKIWLEMGFQEMTGSLVQTGFWNFDALFTAQDHPVREEQDTFYLKGLKGKLPAESVVKAVKKSHEGGIDGSKGWQSDWTEEEAKKVVLRTHTTCLSAQTLMKIAEDVKKGKPAKHFALGKCFRNETVDWSHGFEFNQSEGIVVDENANFRQLLGYLIEFFKKMGFEKLRIRPGYFPYTEPSLEIDVFHEGKGKWLELGGAGMFRPEVTIPMFGKHIPVLAWGPGFDRIIMDFFKIKDLREMYKNDISKLREMKVWR